MKKVTTKQFSVIINQVSSLAQCLISFETVTLCSSLNSVLRHFTLDSLFRFQSLIRHLYCIIWYFLIELGPNPTIPPRSFFLPFVFYNFFLCLFPPVVILIKFCFSLFIHPSSLEVHFVRKSWVDFNCGRFLFFRKFQVNTNQMSP